MIAYILKIIVLILTVSLIGTIVSLACGVPAIFCAAISLWIINRLEKHIKSPW